MPSEWIYFQVALKFGDILDNKCVYLLYFNHKCFQRNNFRWLLHLCMCRLPHLQSIYRQCESQNSCASVFKYYLSFNLFNSFAPIPDRQGYIRGLVHPNQPSTTVPLQINMMVTSRQASKQTLYAYYTDPLKKSNHKSFFYKLV